MSEQLPADPVNLNPNLLCKVWTMTDADTKSELVAAAYDQDQAIIIASNWFAAREIIKPDTHIMVGVFNSTGELIAQIGTIK